MFLIIIIPPVTSRHISSGRFMNQVEWRGRESSSRCISFIFWQSPTNCDHLPPVISTGVRGVRQLTENWNIRNINFTSTTFRHKQQLMPTENLNPQDPPWIGQISTKNNFILIYSFHREDKIIEMLLKVRRMDCSNNLLLLIINSPHLMKCKPLQGICGALDWQCFHTFRWLVVMYMYYGCRMTREYYHK